MQFRHIRGDGKSPVDWSTDVPGHASRALTFDAELDLRVDRGLSWSTSHKYTVHRRDLLEWYWDHANQSFIRMTDAQALLYLIEYCITKHEDTLKDLVVSNCPAYVDISSEALRQDPWAGSKVTYIVTDFFWRLDLLFRNV